MITIIDYKMGNINSVLNILKKIGISARISSNIEDLKIAEKLIIPGVGAFDTGMKNLRQLGFIEVLNKLVIDDKIPILGICLGAQLLTRNSEEGNSCGLGWIDADTIKFNFDSLQTTRKLKVPHMGWNTVKYDKSSKLFKDWDGLARFYFVHSYHVSCDIHDDISSTCLYGREFVASIEKNNIFGVQFHPEKSHKYGMKLLKNFGDL